MARTIDLQKRADLAQRAFELMVSEGVHNVTMSRLAKELGMPRPTLYWYFKDLGAVFEAVLAAADVDLRGHVGAALLAAGEHPIDRLIALVRSTVDFFGSREDEYRVMFQLWAVATGGSPDSLEQRRRDLVLPVSTAAAAELQRGIDARLVRPCDAQTVIDLAFAVIDGAQLQRLLRNADPQKVVDGFCELTLEPLRAPT